MKLPQVVCYHAHGEIALIWRGSYGHHEEGAMLVAALYLKLTAFFVTNVSRTH